MSDFLGHLDMNLGMLIGVAWLVLITSILGIGVRWGARLLPLTSRSREAVLGALPLFDFVLGTFFVLFAVERIFRGSPAFAGIALVGVFFFGLWLLGESLRDVVAGVLLRLGGSVGIGDRVRLDGLQGRVTQLGYRVLTLELSAGDESLVPYSRLTRAAIVRTPHVFGAHRHNFHLPAGTDVEKLRRSVLLCHWSSAARPPVIRVGEDGLDVTVFALDPDAGPAIERFVRRDLE